MLLLSRLFVVLECVHYVIAFQVVCGHTVCPLWFKDTRPDKSMSRLSVSYLCCCTWCLDKGI